MTRLEFNTILDVVLAVAIVVAGVQAIRFGVTCWRRRSRR